MPQPDACLWIYLGNVYGCKGKVIETLWKESDRHIFVEILLPPIKLQTEAAFLLTSGPRLYKAAFQKSISHTTRSVRSTGISCESWNFLSHLLYGKPFGGIKKEEDVFITPFNSVETNKETLRPPHIGKTSWHWQFSPKILLFFHFYNFLSW